MSEKAVGAALAATSVVEGLVVRLHAALPQTQCQRCGYPDCEAYARAIASGDALINRCPPGGTEGVERLAAIAGCVPLSLDPSCGTEQARSVAGIDEAWCIGCTLCIEACPTDAILGSSKRMHTVLPEHCTGCELCVPVCPVDCILMTPISAGRTGWSAWSAGEAANALQRYERHKFRRAKTAGACGGAAAGGDGTPTQSPRHDGPQAHSSDTESPSAAASASSYKRTLIEAAQARARQRKPQRLVD